MRVWQERGRCQIRLRMLKVTSMVWSVVLSITLVQSLHKPPSLRHAPLTTDKGVLPQRLPPSSFLNLHCCRRPICCSTLLQFHLLVLFVHLLLHTEFHRYSGSQSLLQLSTFPNKAQGFDIFVCLLRMCSYVQTHFTVCLRSKCLPKGALQLTKAMSFCAWSSSITACFLFSFIVVLFFVYVCLFFSGKVNITWHLSFDEWIIECTWLFTVCVLTSNEQATWKTQYFIELVHVDPSPSLCCNVKSSCHNSVACLQLLLSRIWLYLFGKDWSLPLLCASE